MWAVDEAVRGSVLVRGHQLDGPNKSSVRRPRSSRPALEPTSDAAPGGWRGYPSYTRLRAPGCYAYQIDTASGTKRAIFLAEGPKVRP